MIGGDLELRQLEVDTGAGNNELNYGTYALFGQGNYKLTESLDVTLGARTSYLKVTSDFGGNSSWHISAYNEELSETMISPKAAFGWQASEDTRFYDSLTSG